MNPLLKKWLDKAPELSDILPGQPLAELAGENRLLIENHGGVSMYSPCQIGVRVAYGILLVSGEQLSLVRMSRRELVIVGKIQGICLERSEG